MEDELANVCMITHTINYSILSRNLPERVWKTTNILLGNSYLERLSTKNRESSNTTIGNFFFEVQIMPPLPGLLELARYIYFPPRVKLYKRYPVIKALFVKAVFAVLSTFRLRRLDINLFYFSLICFLLCNYDVAVSITAGCDTTLFMRE
jgi:hypothetical protein